MLIQMTSVKNIVSSSVGFVFGLRSYDFGLEFVGKCGFFGLFFHLLSLL
jgi:hypothetical protein